MARTFCHSVNSPVVQIRNETENETSVKYITRGATRKFYTHTRTYTNSSHSSVIRKGATKFERKLSQMHHLPCEEYGTLLAMSIIFCQFRLHDAHLQEFVILLRNCLECNRPEPHLSCQLLVQYLLNWQKMKTCSFMR